jgi:hypothetical protein
MADSTKNTPERPAILNRFTSLPFAIDLLLKKEITLLNPETWEDRNDAYYIERYCEEQNLGSVLAICFSMESETFHHWRVFSHGSSGVCIEFDKDKLLEAFSANEGFRHREVSYQSILELQSIQPTRDSWPFLKREPFKDEREFRITFETKDRNMASKRVAIDLPSIRKVTLSPWLPNDVADSVTQIIKKIEGCKNLNVNRSSLIDNARWKAVVTKNDNGTATDWNAQEKLCS